MAESEGMCDSQATISVPPTTVSDRIYNFLISSCEYLLKFWFIMLFIIIWFLRGPLKLTDASNTGKRTT